MIEYKVFPLAKDLTIATIVGGLGLIINIYANINYSLDANDFAIFISLLGVIVGFLFTVLTILYAFEENLKDNPAFKELIISGLYPQIYPIYTDSVLASFYSLISMVLLYFLRNMVFCSIIIYYVFIFIILVVISISFIRSYRCLFVFNLLQKVMSKYNIKSKIKAK